MNDEPEIPPGGARARVADYFGRLADSYGAGEYYTRRRVAVLAALAADLGAARAILDLGCGNGRYLAEFRRMTPDALVVGADLSAPMLLEARRRDALLKNLVRADASAPPFRDASFDLIFCSHVLQFVADTRAAAREIARSLRAGGQLAVTVGGTGGRERLRALMSPEQWRELSEAAFSPHRRIRHRDDADDFSAALEAAGLKTAAREAKFVVSSRGMLEWIGVRWIPALEGEARRRAERALETARDTLVPRDLELSEGLLIGRRPG